MNKYFISLLIIFGFLFQISVVIALSTDEKNDLLEKFQSSEQKGAIIERFQSEQYDLLFDSDLSEFSNEYSDIFSLSKKIDLYDSMSSDIEKERQDAEEKNDELITKITSLEESILILDKDIEDLEAKIKQINNDVIQVKGEIETNTKTIEILKNKIEENREILLEYLVYIYKKGNTAYEGSEVDNLKSILLNEEDISDLINDLYYKGLIQVTAKKLIDNHRQYVSELYLEKVNLEKQEINLKSLRKQGVIEQKILNDKKEYKERILEASKGKQSFYEQYVEKKIALESEIKLEAIKEKIKLNEAREQILEKYGCTYVDLSSNTVEARALQASGSKCYSINKMIYSEGQLTESDNIISDSNIMGWPVDPYLGISAFFDDDGYVEELGANHNAIDIVTAQGTSVEAPMDGYVVYLNPPDSEEYAYIALKHADGYMTVYGHISEVLVNQFDYVEKGEIFARSGGEYGTNGAGFLTTGAHLHFEVFKDEEYVDPLRFLDLSYMKFQKIPEEYKNKYYMDFQSRKGYSYKDADSNSKVFHLEGSNEIERQKYLISTYAVGDFNNWQMWVDESLDGNIDPSLVMCIGLAETTLGKHLSTPYNIGNVGNNDRGDRVGYPNARSGVYSIIYTLNNKYFRDINSLDKLSGEGRIVSSLPGCAESGEFCYATDTNHWHSNVTKCLMHLKGMYVSDNYNFRLIK